MPSRVFSFPAEAEEAGKLYGLTRQEMESLQQVATASKAKAYCPYSNFRVGAALLSRAGKVTPGANVENASYPVGTCAERVAFGTAIVAGELDFKALAVASDIAPPASPCGMCRQYISEFLEKQTPVLMFDKDNGFLVMTVEELLPNSFGPKSMSVQVPAAAGN